MNSDFKKKIVKIAAGGMVISTLTSCIGFLREIITGSVLGTTYIADAFNVAVSIPTILMYNIAGAVGTTFVPIYLTIKEKEGDFESQKFVNNVLCLVFLLGLLIAAISVTFAKPILSFMAPGFDAVTMNTAVQIGRLVFISIVFLSINEILARYLNANNRFIITFSVAIPSSLIMIAALFLYPRIGIMGLATATLMGSCVQTVLIGINALVSGFKFKPVVDLKSKIVRDMLMLAIPVFFGSSVYQISALVDKILASGLMEGSISALNYANKLVQFITGSTAIIIGSLIYPQLSQFIATKDDTAFKYMLTKSFNVVTVLLLPITVAACILNTHVVRMLFERGVFNTESTTLTASALLFYSLGIVFIGYSIILSRCFYALKNTKTPMICGVFSVSIGIILNIILIRFMAHNGLALSTSISSAVLTVLLTLNLRKKIGGIGGKEIAICFVKSAFCAAVMGALVYLTQPVLLNIISGADTMRDVLVFIILAIIGAIVYLGLMLALKTKELQWIFEQIMRVLLRKK